MHDCGKVTTPVHVMDKATKLETIFDRIELVRTRFEVLKRDAEIEYLKALAAGKGDPDAHRATFESRLEELRAELAFLEKANIGGEFLEPEKRAKIAEIGRTPLRAGRQGGASPVTTRS